MLSGIAIAKTAHHGGTQWENLFLKKGAVVMHGCAVLPVRFEYLFFSFTSSVT
jgi:hypothetical protein